jgi:hypothetical protein
MTVFFTFTLVGIMELELLILGLEVLKNQNAYSNCMKNLIVLVLLIFMPKCYLIGQNDFKFSTSVSETVSFDFQITGNVYLGANALFGIQYKQFNTSVNYQFGGLYSYNWNDLNDYNFHLLGINCEYRFLSFAKKNSPI